MKFCKYCGTALQDGQYCTCSLALEERGQTPAPQMQQGAVPPTGILQVGAPQGHVSEPQTNEPQTGIPPVNAQPIPVQQIPPQPIPQMGEPQAPVQQPYVPQQPYTAQPSQQTGTQTPPGQQYAPQPQPQYTPQPAVKTEPGKAAVLFKELLTLFITLFKAPAKAIDSVHENASFAKSFILLGAQSLVMALAISITYGRFMKYLAGGFMGIEVKFTEYLKFFFSGFFIVAAFSIILACMLYLFSMLFKKQINFLQALSYVAGASIFITIGTIPVWTFSLMLGISFSFFMVMIIAVWFSVSACAAGSLYAMVKKNTGADKAIIITLCAYAPAILTIGLIASVLM